MDRFIEKYRKDVTGVLSGWDRLMIRGTLRILAAVGGMMNFLSYLGVLLKDFGGFVEGVTSRIREASLTTAEALQRPVIRGLPSGTRKEELAREIADADGIDEGLIAVFCCLEPCISYSVRGNRRAKKLVLKRELRKCLHYYHYYNHPDFGLMHVRLQTWLPYTIQVCVNGRSWLARQMDRAQLGYERRDNCFVWLEDVDAAQGLMDRLVRLDWVRALTPLAAAVNPALPEVLQGYRAGYYWSAYESEWATDILFRSPEALARIYPALVHYGITTFSSPDVLRFLAKRPGGNFRSEVLSSYRRMPEGVRIKHAVHRNSVKMYDKKGSVLRVETTINNPHVFKVSRPPENDPDGTLAPRRLRKGVAGMARRARLSQACNERYLQAMSCLDVPTPLRAIVEKVCRPKTRRGRRVRALRPWSGDLPLLQAISRGEFAIAGFRNRDLAAVLFGTPPRDAAGRRRRSARVTRLLRLLRNHGLLRKVPRERRYLLTRRGRTIATAILACQDLTLQQLKDAAA